MLLINVAVTKDTFTSMQHESETVSQVLKEIGDVPFEGVKNSYKGLELTTSKSEMSSIV